MTCLVCLGVQSQLVFQTVLGREPSAALLADSFLLSLWLTGLLEVLNFKLHVVRKFLIFLYFKVALQIGKMTKIWSRCLKGWLRCERSTVQWYRGFYQIIRQPGRRSRVMHLYTAQSSSLKLCSCIAIPAIIGDLHGVEQNSFIPANSAFSIKKFLEWNVSLGHILSANSSFILKACFA